MSNCKYLTWWDWEEKYKFKLLSFSFSNWHSTKQYAVSIWLKKHPIFGSCEGDEARREGLLLKWEAAADNINYCHDIWIWVIWVDRINSCWKALIPKRKKQFTKNVWQVSERLENGSCYTILVFHSLLVFFSLEKRLTRQKKP